MGGARGAIESSLYSYSTPLLSAPSQSQLERSTVNSCPSSLSLARSFASKRETIVSYFHFDILLLVHNKQHNLFSRSHARHLSYRLGVASCRVLSLCVPFRTLIVSCRVSKIFILFSAVRRGGVRCGEAVVRRTAHSHLRITFRMAVTTGAAAESDCWCRLIDSNDSST